MPRSTGLAGPLVVVAVALGALLAPMALPPRHRADHPRPGPTARRGMAGPPVEVDVRQCAAVRSDAAACP